MKIRNFFVSNSSSSSFVIPLCSLSSDQLCNILDPDYSSQNCGEDEGFPYTWHISVDRTEGIVEGYTSMDNFSMDQYLREIDVPDHIITWKYD